MKLYITISENGNIYPWNNRECLKKFLEDNPTKHCIKVYELDEMPFGQGKEWFLRGFLKDSEI